MCVGVCVCKCMCVCWVTMERMLRKGGSAGLSYIRAMHVHLSNAVVFVESHCSTHAG